MILDLHLFFLLLALSSSFASHFTSHPYRHTTTIITSQPNSKWVS